MNKPRYMVELMKIIMMWLGIAFVISGVLCYIGIIPPKESSMIQVSSVLGISFGLIGLCFFVAQFALYALTKSKNQMRAELLAEGIRLTGVVEKVYLQNYTHYGRTSPYRILYKYSYNGKEYEKKSDLLWEKPSVTKGDAITVYTNDLGESVLE